MQVSRVRALRGPNLWSRQTAIEAILRTSSDALSNAGQLPVHSGPSATGSFWMPSTNAWLLAGGV